MKDEEKMSKKVKNNGFNPTWNHAFHFSIKVPDLAILEIKVRVSSKHLFFLASSNAIMFKCIFVKGEG